MGVDEPRRHHAAVRVEPREPRQRVAAGLEAALDVRRAARPRRSGPPSRRRPARPATPGRRPSARRGPRRPPGPSPRRSPPASVATCAAPWTRRPGASVVAATALDRGGGSCARPPGGVPGAGSAAARRSSRAISGEKSRSLMAAAAAARRSSTEAPAGASTWSATSRERGERREPDELRLVRARPRPRRQLAHDLPDAPHRRRPEVEQVHRDLGARPDRRAPAPRPRNPFAWTLGSPPPDSRTRRAIRFASSTSSVSRLMFQAMRNGRAPTAIAPARGCIRAGPKSGWRPLLGDLDLEALVLAAPHVGELHPVGAGRRLRVQVDGQVP